MSIWAQRSAKAQARTTVAKMVEVFLKPNCQRFLNFCEVIFFLVVARAKVPRVIRTIGRCRGLKLWRMLGVSGLAKVSSAKDRMDMAPIISKIATKIFELRVVVGAG